VASPKSTRPATTLLVCDTDGNERSITGDSPLNGIGAVQHSTNGNGAQPDAAKPTSATFSSPLLGCARATSMWTMSVAARRPLKPHPHARRPLTTQWSHT
jgi:hypothetical protein